MREKINTYYNLKTTWET